MIEVSNEFKKAVYAPIRKCMARVTFEILDLEAFKDNTKKVTSETLISRKDQLTNKIREKSHKYATFEQDYFKLDGSFHIPPKKEENLNSELGWWSDVLCGSDGTFNSYQVLEFNFNKEHSSMGITLLFDIQNNEYASDFDIAVHGATGLIVNKSIVNNTESKFIFIEHLSSYNRIVITIKKWCKPYRRAKIVEVDFGVIKQYEDDKLVSINLLEQMDVVSNYLPSNELKFTIDNSTKEFNILNPSGFFSFLKEKQEVFTEIGVELEDGAIEYIPMGKHYLKEWQSDEGTLTTTFTARDIIDALEEENYIYSTLAEKSLYNIAVDVLSRLNIEYKIDPNLKNVKTNGYLPKLKVREALQYIAIAGRCAVYQDRATGKLVIKQFRTLDESTSYINFCGGCDLSFGVVYPQVNKGFDIKNITLDNMYAEPQIKLDKLVKSVEVTVNTYNQETEEKEILNTDFVINGEDTIFLEYKTYGNAKLEVTGVISWSILGHYANGAELKIKANGTVNIKVRGYALVTNKTTFVLTDNSIKEGAKLSVDNPLIDNPEVAKKVAEWLFYESRLRALYEANWRQNPALECGDIVIIEDGFGEKKQSRITRQEFEYKGYLSGKTESRGGV